MLYVDSTENSRRNCQMLYRNKNVPLIKRDEDKYTQDASISCFMLWNQNMILIMLCYRNMCRRCLPPESFTARFNVILTRMPLCFFVFQVPPVQQAAPIGSPPALPRPILLSPTSMAPGGSSFFSTEFDLLKLAPGKWIGRHHLKWRSKCFHVY